MKENDIEIEQEITGNENIEFCNNGTEKTIYNLNNSYPLLNQKQVEENVEKEQEKTDNENIKSYNDDIDKTAYNLNNSVPLIKTKNDEEIGEKEQEANSMTLQNLDGDEMESDEEKDTPNQVFNKNETYTINDLLVHKFSFNELTQPQLTKIYDLKVFTEDEIAKTIKNKNSKNPKNIVKALVSKKKNRFCYDGYDLDLTYITTRIIAMGFPSTSIEGLFRNPMEEVKKFFNTRHPNHYKIYNLCEEKKYADNIFFKQGYFPFKDHEAPPINLMRPFCEDAKAFLDEDEKNVIAVHCKAGKGRTGTLICCLLMYMNVFKTSDECLQFYGMMRVENGKGVTIPSQIRYVEYFEKILKDNMAHPIIFVKKIIKKIRMYGIPTFHKVYTPLFIISNNGQTYNNYKKKTVIEGEGITSIIDFNIEKGFNVEGDVYVSFFRIHILGKKDKIFKFWFNTNFIPENNIYEFKKKSIDKACKDKQCKYYKPGFKIEVYFEDV